MSETVCTCLSLLYLYVFDILVLSLFGFSKVFDNIEESSVNETDEYHTEIYSNGSMSICYQYVPVTKRARKSILSMV